MTTATTTATTTAPFELTGPLQARVMHHLWAKGRQTVHQIHAALNAEPGAKQLAYTTVLTVMRNLARRRLVDQHLATIGRSHTFESRSTRENYLAQLLAFVRRTYFRDDAVELSKHLPAALGL